MGNYTSAYTGEQIDTAVSKINSINKSALEINQTFTDLENNMTSALNSINTLTSNQKIFTLSTQTVTGSAGINLDCHKYGPLVQVNINNTTTGAIAAWGLVGTLPVKYRPKNIGLQVFSDNPLNSGQGFYIGDPNTGEIRTNAAIANGTGCWTTMTFIGEDD